MSRRKSPIPYRLSEKSYLLSDISRSNSPLPLLCFIENGYYGASAWDTVSSGEVIYLNTLEKRTRALASDGQKHYSIPLDYPLKFSVISKGNVSSTKTIEEIVNRYTLPVTLKVDQKNTTLHLVSNLRVILHLGDVDVTGTYDEKYFTGHSVIRNELQNEMIMLPTFLKVRIRIIEGITGYSTEQWVNVLETWKAAVKQTSPNAITPPIDIVMFSTIPQEAESKTATTTRKVSEDIYETLEPVTYVKLNFNLAQQRKTNVYTMLSAVTQPTSTIDSTADTAATRNQSTVAEKTPAEQASVRNSSSSYQTELQQTVSNRKPPGLNRPAPPPKLYKTLSEDHARKRVPTPPDEPTEKPSSNELSPSTGQTPPPPTTQGRPFATESLSNQPNPHSPDDEIDPDYQISPRRHSKIHSLKDIPASVENLNSEEVADCLRLLKMSKYVDSFLANQVDGALLSEFNEDILTNDLQMSQLHAKKLVMFAQKGWRPLQGPSESYL